MSDELFSNIDWARDAIRSNRMPNPVRSRRPKAHPKTENREFKYNATRADVPNASVSLRRIALDDVTHAGLRMESANFHIPVQDLIGAACMICLQDMSTVRLDWHRLAERLTRIRRHKVE